MLAVNLLIENLRQNISADAACLKEHLDEGRRLIKIPIQNISDDDYEMMDALHGQLKHSSERMRTYDQRWYELHGELKGLDDCYKVVYNSKQLFQTNSPMYLAALAEDLYEMLRARITHLKRHRRELRQTRKVAFKQQASIPDHKLSVQYSVNENHNPP
ncbi:hypothetical protein M3Y97_00350200 [Aphelenchoides bicaudatus]|nr:hypothetical protein M3Y97_00350200 [Aphelenchoides bicaudatus]